MLFCNSIGKAHLTSLDSVKFSHQYIYIYITYIYKSTGVVGREPNTWNSFRQMEAIPQIVVHNWNVAANVKLLSILCDVTTFTYARINWNERERSQYRNNGKLYKKIKLE